VQEAVGLGALLPAGMHDLVEEEHKSLVDVCGA
jgi:hypothetical protein